MTAIGEAGYFVEEIEGERRQITIGIETGSALPHATFLDDVVADMKNCANNNQWHSPIALEGNTNYGSSNCGQSEDSSNFVDASSVWLPDLGEIADLKD